jgi:6-phosphogluconolactonase/glucosamine-6-phosphate isomerase/deaminase
MGADMHTASLFPGADRLAEALAPDGTPLLAADARPKRAGRAAGDADRAGAERRGDPPSIS